MLVAFHEFDLAKQQARVWMRDGSWLGKEG